MNIEDFPEAKPVFDEPAVKAVFAKTGLPLAPGTTVEELRESLEDIARQHYWNEFHPPDQNGESEVIRLDAIAEASVAPSRLRNRLIAIEQSSKRVFAGRSRRPLAEKIAELLERLGRHKNGSPMTHSGTEAAGHGGSERSAVWLCLVRAITATESPPKDYRPGIDRRPWPAQRLESAIQALVRFIQSPDKGRKDADAAARAIHGWVQRSIPMVGRLVTSNKARHHGNVALDITLSNLDTLYREAFGKVPSLYRSSTKGSAPKPNAWQRFLLAVLERVLPPDDLPSITALDERWRRLTYPKR
jgi:hypothetical protein